MTDRSTGIVIEPRTRAWLDQLPAGPPLYEMSPQDARQVLRDVQASVTVDAPPADVTDRIIAGGPTGEIALRVVRPGGAGGTLPLLLHLHGGGWILGDRYTHDRMTRELAAAAAAVVIFVDYLPAPEAQYPVQIEQAYAALEWAVRHAAELGVDPARTGVVGDSVGGNMATVLALMAKQRGGPAIATQVLFYPVTDADFHTWTYDRYSQGPWLSRQAMCWFWDAYLPDVTRRSEPTAAPLRAPDDQLAGMPPTLIVNGEHDVLRDEGEAYARRLIQLGVPVTQVRYAATIHDFMLLNPIANTPAPRAALAQAGGFLRRALR
jgi:acetyl esterase